MAAVSQPGSRAGLISAMVVAVVVALIMTVMYFVANADAKANAQKLDQLTKKYAKVIEERELSAGWLRDLPKDAKTGTEMLLRQRDSLVAAITGNKSATAENALAMQTAV